MSHHLRITLGLCALAVSLPQAALAADIQPAVYQRVREVAWGQDSATGPLFPGEVGAFPPVGGSYGAGFFTPWFAPQITTGSWYQRPYPYHFDYYRWRYSMPPQVAPPDCPCAE